MPGILIIDDESRTRKGLLKYVNWENLGINPVEETGNVWEALKLIEKNKPDIVLSDICMPEMNGIELGMQIRKLNPDCQIIFLSGYSDKEYLLGAIEVRAASYIEKPVSIPEVETALKKAVDRYQEQKEKTDRWKRTLTENEAMIKQRLINRLTFSVVSVELLKEDYTCLGLDWLNKNRFLTIIFRVKSNRIAVIETIMAELNQYFQEIGYISAVKDSCCIVYLCAYRGESETAGYKTAIRKIKEYIQRKKGCGIYCAVGPVVDDITEMYKSYQAAVITIQKLFFLGFNRMEYYAPNREEKLEVDEQLFADFEQGLRKSDYGAICDTVRQLYGEIVKQDTVLISHIKGVYFRLLNELFREAGKMGMEEKWNENEMVSYIWEKLHGFDTLMDCQEYLEEQLEEYFRNAQELADSNKTIIAAISYIQDYYRRADLCLNDIARSVYISPNYLSNLFKKKMGTTISQYITDVRMEHAKELLRGRKLKLYDVAMQTGYKDSNYFTKIFKKTTGVTPSEYREKFNL